MEPVPSAASLSRIFRDQGVARIESNKKPRASYRRFVFPAPKLMLAARRDRISSQRRMQMRHLPAPQHYRLVIASHVSWGETSEGTIAVVSKGIVAYGVLLRRLSDNGAALNPSRRRVRGLLVASLR